MPEILNIPLYGGTMRDAVEDIIAVCGSGEQPSNRLVSATGAHGLVYARRNPGFGNTLKRFYRNLPDGMPSVWVGRYFKGARKMERCRGPNFFGAVMSATAGTNIRHYFCGGKEGIADQLKQACERKFHNHQIVGTFCPPFRFMTDDELSRLGEEIGALHADVIWIGLSTPKQEEFAVRLSQFTQSQFIICIGAAFDFHIGAVREAPEWIQKIGMEWFFRLCMEPRRLYKRYFEIVPLFIYYNLLELLGLSSERRSRV